MSESITPIVEYKSITINGKSIALSGSCRASFISPYNKINIVMRPTNHSLSYYEVRVTKADAEYDIGVGVRVYWASNIALNADTSFSIEINSTNFSEGDGEYRISLYAKDAVDGSWDVTYIFMTTESDGSTLNFIPSDADGFEVITYKEIE